MAAIENELLLFDWESGVETSWRSLEEAGTGSRLNDGRCDPAARFVVGSMFAYTAVGRTTGSLYQVSGSSTPAVLRTKVGVTNGIAFDAHRQRMYFADTPTERVVVYDYDSDTGECRNERLFLDYSELAGKPDGACVDSEGCYWSASVYGWGVIRVTPAGVVDQRIELPVQKPTMPAFGGPDLSTLYITTIGKGATVPSEPGRDGFQPGAVLAIDTNYSGIVEPQFTGPRDDTW